MQSGEEGEVEPFPLDWLPTEVLSGVLQRVSTRAKVEAEGVSGRLAAVTRALAWRHCRPLALHARFSPFAPIQLQAGNLTVELTFADADAGAVVRFFVERARVDEFRAVSQLPDALETVSYVRLTEKQAQMSAMAAVLSAPGVHLRALSLEGTAAELFGSDEPVTALFRRHAATLEQAALGFRLGGPKCEELSAAVRACVGLRRFTGRLQWGRRPRRAQLPEHYGWSEALEVLLNGWQLQQCAVSLVSSEGAHVMPRQPFACVQELHLGDVHVEGMGGVFPKLQVLHVEKRVVDSVIGGEESPLWLLCDVIEPFYYFYRADAALPLSVQVQVQVQQPHAGLPHWKMALNEMASEFQMSLECYDAAIREQWRLAPPATPPPSVPPQFASNGECSVFTLQHSRDRFQLLLAVYFCTSSL